MSLMPRFVMSQIDQGKGREVCRSVRSAVGMEMFRA